MERLGIVDLGSNTARLSVFEYEPEHWFRLADEIREPVRLGEGMLSDSTDAPHLTAGAIDRAEAALRLFADYAEATNLSSLQVIATSAVRDAENRDEFLGRIADLPLDLHVLSGEEEGELSVTSTANAFRGEDAWVIDLGGGSVQVSRMEGRECVSATSLPLGAVRLRETYLPENPESDEALERFEREVSARLAPIAEQIRATDIPIVAIGGTIRNLARSVQKYASYPLRLLHNYELLRGDLEELIEKRFLGETYARRASVRGINPDRADVILGGALLYRLLLRDAGRDSLQISGSGVREGVLYQHFLPAPHRVEDVRTFSVFNLLQQYPQPPRHIRQVRKLARELLEGLAPLHDLDEADYALLDAAAILHDIGMAVGYHRHHKHGAYLVHSTKLDGFDHREQALVALLVRYHRRGIPSLGVYQPLMEPDDDRRLLQLAVCLRLAEQFERSRAGRVTAVEVSVGPETVSVAGPSLEEPSVEYWEAQKQSDLFERAWGRKLALRATDGSNGTR